MSQRQRNWVNQCYGGKFLSNFSDEKNVTEDLISFDHVTLVELPGTTSLDFLLGCILSDLFVVLANVRMELVTLHVSLDVDDLVYTITDNLHLVLFIFNPVEMESFLIRLLVITPSVASYKTGDRVPLVLILLGIISFRDGGKSSRPNKSISIGSNENTWDQAYHQVKMAEILKFVPHPVGGHRDKMVVAFFRELDISLTYLKNLMGDFERPL